MALEVSRLEINIFAKRGDTEKVGFTKAIRSRNLNAGLELARLENAYLKKKINEKCSGSRKGSLIQESGPGSARCMVV